MPHVIERFARSIINRWRPVRAVVKSRPVQFAIQTTRASRAVEERGKFVIRQLGPPQVASYCLRESGLVAFLRHRTRDVNIFNEIIGGQNAYEPPAPVSAVLASQRDPLRVIDLGGNIGLFGIFILERFPDAEVITLEPDPANAALLRRAIAANRLDARWRLIEAAATNGDGEVPFVPGLFADSHIAAAGDAATVTVPAVNIFDVAHSVDLLKVDVEGAEWDIILDPRMASLDAKVIVLEWHAANSPPGDPEAAAVQALARAGYVVQPAYATGSRNGVVWAWRQFAAARIAQ